MKLEPKAEAMTDTDHEAAIDGAIRAIPPAWPLASSVAVNPFLGQTDRSLAEVSAQLRRIAGASATIDRSWYAARLADGTIDDSDLSAALATSPNPAVSHVTHLRTLATRPHASRNALPTVADLAADASGIDWPAIIAERIGHFAADWFDSGQALWAAPRDGGLWSAWRAASMYDLTAEIAGLTGFARQVTDASRDAARATADAVATLGLPQAALETYFHQLLTTTGGWGQAARYRLWMAELGGEADTAAHELLAVRLFYDAVLYRQYAAQIDDRWAATIATHAQPIAASIDDQVDALLQEATDRAAQRRLFAKLATPAPQPDAAPLLHAVFCIDVRSEVFRRALEGQDARIRTSGFAGFFGLTTAHRRFASDTVELRLPVLLNPALVSEAGGKAEVDRDTRYRARAARAWGRFKLAAVSSFAFVEATGPLYIVKLLRDAAGWNAVPPPRDPAPLLDPPLPLADRIGAATSILRAMSLTSDFAPTILIAGHGANTVNNPHASALHCGACGGYSGEVNARLVATLLNDVEVRSGLVAGGIAVPAATRFVAALHDTTTDEVTIYDADVPDQITDWLHAAGIVARTERALRLPSANSPAQVTARSRDWSQVRPEWGLAGCQAFIAAPRAVTAGRDMSGATFLHDYDWRQDAGFGTLELILTAPVVVASWISLQYYGSVVAPALFGGGNKLLHNVVGGVGVYEGNGGVMRAGLPWQSVHDGEQLAHDPVRLSVCVAAPREAITDILAKHDGVRALFDNRWLHLFALEDGASAPVRYTGGLEWEATPA